MVIPGYRRVLDADIEACSDSIDHTALMDRMRRQGKDKHAGLSRRRPAAMLADHAVVLDLAYRDAGTAYW
ncbi:hypothetical protein [Nocardia barduliensis]|uniref:hypothetical protein n=1 Tax=Nocardia barduliensis TaxID=2736643 RepID=UPI001573B401